MVHYVHVVLCCLPSMQIGVSMDETVTEKDLDDLLQVFGSEETAVSIRVTSDHQVRGYNFYSPKQRFIFGISTRSHKTEFIFDEGNFSFRVLHFKTEPGPVVQNATLGPSTKNQTPDHTNLVQCSAS